MAKTKEERAAYYQANKEHIKAKSAAARLLEDKERVTAYKAAWYRANADRLAVSGAEYHLANKESRNEKSARWSRENPDRCRAAIAKRRSAKLKRTPVWSDLKAIAKIYSDCAELQELAMPVLLHVDHIIPLQGKLVSGLHVPSNLQIIPASENLSKSNRYEVG